MPHGPMRGRLLRCTACGQPVVDPVFGPLAGAVWHGKVFHTDERGGHLFQVVGPEGHQPWRVADFVLYR